MRGRRLNRYWAELQAVRLLICGIGEWKGVEAWITLGNDAVLGDISRLMKGRFGKKDHHV